MGVDLWLRVGLSVSHQGLRVSGDYFAHDVEVVGRAELDVLGPRFRARRDMSRSEVEGIARFEDLLVVAAVEGQTAFEHVAQCGDERRSSGSPFMSGVASRSTWVVRNRIAVPSMSSRRSEIGP